MAICWLYTFQQRDGEKNLIIATTTCTSWRCYARVRAVGSRRRHWAGLSQSESAMPFLDTCSDPSTVSRYLPCPAPLFPFFPTSLRVFLRSAAASLSHLDSPSPHLTSLLTLSATLESRRPFFSPAENPVASREMAYGAGLSTRQAVHPATSRLIRSRVQPLWYSSLSPRFHAGYRFFSSLPSFDPSARFAPCRARLSSIRLLCARTNLPPTYLLLRIYHEMVAHGEIYLFLKIDKNIFDNEIVIWKEIFNFICVNFIGKIWAIHVMVKYLQKFNEMS